MAFLGVRAGALNLLVPVGEVVEVINPGNFTPIPLTLSWFRGLHNVRGTLYSVIDLPALLGFAPVAAGADARLLLLHAHRVRNTGVLVSRLHGMLQPASLVSCTEEGQAPPPALPALRRAGLAQMLGQPSRDGQQSEWYPLDIGTLIEQPEFLDVAALPAQGAHA